MRYFILISSALIFLQQDCLAQWEYRNILKTDNVTYPETSKRATVSNTIGITEIEITYHSPATKNREVFGVLEPYNKIWRAGANESTTISFQDSVLVNDHRVAPGIYGIHIIPNPEEWTVIFSSNHNQWGSFYYDQDEDVLRFKVKPSSIPHREHLKYDFENVADNSIDVTLEWATSKISFTIDVDEINTTLAVMRDELRTLPRFHWHGNREAALYCWLHDVNLEEAIDWIDRSIRLNKNFKNIYLKALILKDLGKEEEAKTFMSEALSLGTYKSFMYKGMEVLGHHNSPEKAIELFVIAIQHFPQSSEIRAQLANVYGIMGNQEKVLKTLEDAMPLAKSQKEIDLLESIKRRFKL